MINRYLGEEVCRVQNLGRPSTAMQQYCFAEDVLRSIHEGKPLVCSLKVEPEGAPPALLLPPRSSHRALRRLPRLPRCWSSLKEWGRSRPRADLDLVVDLSFAFAPPSFRRAEVGVGVKDRPEADREAAVGP